MTTEEMLRELRFAVGPARVAVVDLAAARLRELEAKVEQLAAHNNFLAGRSGSPDDMSEALHALADTHEAREGAGANTLVLRGAAGRIRAADAMGAAVGAALERLAGTWEGRVLSEAHAAWKGEGR